MVVIITTITMKLEQLHLNNQILSELTKQDINNWLTDVDRPRAPGGEVTYKQKSLASLKFYISPECKDTVATYCSANNISISHFIRLLINNHFLNLLQSDSIDL